jgi:type II secretory pathway component PulJ
MVAAVIVIAFVIALLVFFINVSIKRQSALLEEMVQTNKELAVATNELENEKSRLARANKELEETTSDLNVRTGSPCVCAIGAWWLESDVNLAGGEKEAGCIVDEAVQPDPVLLQNIIR